MVNAWKLNNLKKCLEGHNSTIIPTGDPYVACKGELKLAGKARQEWAEKTEQSWTKHKKASGNK